MCSHEHECVTDPWHCQKTGQQEQQEEAQHVKDEMRSPIGWLSGSVGCWVMVVCKTYWIRQAGLKLWSPSCIMLKGMYNVPVHSSSQVHTPKSGRVMIGYAVKVYCKSALYKSLARALLSTQSAYTVCKPSLATVQRHSKRPSQGIVPRPSTNHCPKTNCNMLPGTATYINGSSSASCCVVCSSGHAHYVLSCPSDIGAV